MNFGDLKPALGELAKYLKGIERHTNCLVCNTSGPTPSASINVANASVISTPIVNAIISGQNPTPHITSAGTNNAITAGYKAISITKTNGTGTVTITLSDGSTFPLTAQNELFADASSQYYSLPAYGIASADGGTWKWHGIK